jgi:hypothetical protein
MIVCIFLFGVFLGGVIGYSADEKFDGKIQSHGHVF